VRSVGNLLNRATKALQKAVKTSDRPDYRTLSAEGTPLRVGTDEQSHLWKVLQ
jgi:hypothetical protein